MRYGDRSSFRTIVGGKNQVKLARDFDVESNRLKFFQNSRHLLDEFSEDFSNAEISNRDYIQRLSWLGEIGLRYEKNNLMTLRKTVFKS